MGPHDQDHETLLVQIVVGDLPRSSPQASQLLANCADCRAKLGELDGLEEQLAAAGRDERADVAQAAVGELDARAQLRLEEFINARLPRRSLLSRRNRLVALALAASLCGLLGQVLILQHQHSALI